MPLTDYMDGQRYEKSFGKLEENLGVDGQIFSCFFRKSPSASV
jgi:hypothetical protein